MLQIIRRTIQIFVLMLVFLLPFLGLLEIVEAYYRGHYVYMAKGNIWQGAFIFTDKIFKIFVDDPITVISEIKGTLFWSFTVFGFTITDPLAFLGYLFSSKAFYLDFLISSLFLVGLTLVFGRVYCSWICPMNLIFELNNIFRKLLIKLNIKPLNVGFNRLHKYMILIVGCLISFILGIHVLYFLYPPIILNREVLHFFYFRSFGIGLSIFIILLFIEISLSQRAFCRYFCPGGALWSLMGIKRLVKVEWDKQLCDDCGKCNLACEFGLNPMRGEMGMECDNCGRCIAKCKPDALKWGVSIPFKGKVDVDK